MKPRSYALAACLLLGLLAGDIAFGAGCDPLAAADSGIASRSAASDESCGPSDCASDCFCCSALSSGATAPVVLAPGPLALAPTFHAPRVLEGAPPLLDHPPQL